ncbi:hypothetical protein BDV06DRAFT_207959 [Aspergillus oleicola]
MRLRRHDRRTFALADRNQNGRRKRSTQYIALPISYYLSCHGCGLNLLLSTNRLSRQFG